MIAGISNAVNLTDGLDGLATGASMMVFGAYTLVNIWQNNQWCGQTDVGLRQCYEVRDPLDLAVVAAAHHRRLLRLPVVERLAGKIFMGDTGSLSLGGALAGLAVLTRTELLLADARRAVRDRDAVGDPAGRLLQGHQGQTAVPDGAAAPPLRAARAGTRSRS